VQLVAQFNMLLEQQTHHPAILKDAIRLYDHCQLPIVGCLWEMDLFSLPANHYEISTFVCYFLFFWLIDYSIVQPSNEIVAQGRSLLGFDYRLRLFYPN